MRKYFVFVILSLFVSNSYAIDFSGVVNDVKIKCLGISDELVDLKKMAGINTVITGVGTATATGATVVGIVKTSVDKDLRSILESVDNIDNSTVNPSGVEILDVYDGYITQYDNIETAQTELYDKSKTLGNWRTGLLGVGAATNVAGAVVAANNKVSEDLQTHINDCVQSVTVLQDAVGQARIDGIDVSGANKIISECGKWKNTDLSIINNRAKGAMISSVVGATTGVVGTITSAVSNSDKVRQEDADKEKKLNTASNILAGGTAVASGTATVFNATQISAVKKIAKIAEDCEGVLR
ncbi:MAG: hypothetical protein IKM94_03580 [Alphaproteobacteria bacterium]|nr:hypothetical protein [Alphaproteobacteria bacterium]